MGLCLQVSTGYVASLTGSTTFDALTALSGDSFNIPAFTPGTRAGLVDVWGGISGHSGEFDIRSPNFADNIRGLRMAYQYDPTLSGVDGNPQFLTGRNVIQPLYPSDTLIVEANGTASDHAELSFLSFYADLPGCDMQLKTWGEIEPRIVNTLGIRVSCTSGSAGAYGTALNFTSSDDRLVANTTYAILGVTSQLASTTVALSGPETSNRFVGAPLHWDLRQCADYFVYVAKQYGIPSIPTLNGSNKAQWQIKTADVSGAVASALTVQLAELK